MEYRYCGNTDRRSILSTRPLDFVRNMLQASVETVRACVTMGISRRSVMEKKEEAIQEMDALVRKRKWRNRLGIAAAAAMAIGISAVSISSYIRTRQTASQKNMDEPAYAQNADFNGQSGMVMATGTTSVGVNAVTFEIDFLEDTSLYVERVYLENGDSVEAGDKYIKFTDASIADAREELKAAALNAQLAYRSGQISDGESRLQAKYTYDMAVLEAQFAQQVYDDTIAQLDADYAQSVKTYEEAQQEYNEYLERVQNNTFYEDYDIASLKTAYEEAEELYAERKEYWEVTDDELKSGSSENMGTSGLMTLGGSAGGETESGGKTDLEKSEPQENPGEDSEENAVPKEDSGDSNSDTNSDIESKDESKREGTTSEAEPGKEMPVPNDGADFAGFGSMGRQAEQDAQNDRKWIIRTVSLLEQEAEDAEEKYTTALEEYEDEIASAELTLQVLLSRLETAREDFVDAQVSYQKQSLNATTVYETAVAKGKTAQDDYDTQLTSLKDSLDRLQDAQKEADSNLALFEKLVGDGYLYVEESGTVLMLMAEAGKALTGGSMIFAYSNPEQISVSVSVSQNDIARLYVGETATVIISDYGSYSGVIETINPVASSNSRTSVNYTVTVNVQGDVKGLDSNLTASVIFGEGESETKPSGGETPEQGSMPSSLNSMPKDFMDTASDREEEEHGQSGETGQTAYDTQD